MPISVNLSEYKCFKEGSNLILDNKINFIFGKNGTGKSTIVKSIENQFGSEYELKIFNGYEGIIGQKEELEAIILGTENTEIQKLVEEKEKDIFNINEDLNVNSTKDNIAKKYTETNQKYIKQMDKIDTFFSKEASRIKNMDDPYISSHNYDKNNFKLEIPQAKLLGIDDIKKYIKIISEEKKDDIKFQDFPTLNPDKTLKRVNNILGKSISLKIKIPELEQDENKRNFAREGIKIHKHIPGEKCAFCGNIINEDRWILLEKYFNNKVTNLEDEIDGMKQDIQSEKDLINNVELINENNFYQNFKELIKEYNNKIYKVKSEYLKFLQILESHLSDKEKHLFTKTSPITIEMPENFSEINNKYKIIINENNLFSKNLKEQKENAQSQLRYHEIKKSLEKFNYSYESEELKKIENEKIKFKGELSKKKELLNKKIEEKNNLIKQTKNEEILANKINLCLKSSGIESFKLKLIPNTLNQGNGFYKIEGFDGCIRDINKLSTGEKNIIAFLYFIFKLESPENTTKNKIIIFDDPMNSNDDTMQYLIISKIQELYTNNSLLKDNDKFLLLTHNIHFYLNVRPYYNSFDDDRIKKYNNKINKHNESIENEEDKLKEDLTYYEKNGYYKLNLNGNCSEIMRIKNKDDDYKSNYHALWDDLIYLYENNRTSSMINNCRRILETYINFHNLNSQDFYKNNKEAQKLFNVNSHFIDDFEIDFNSNSREQIIALLKGVFKNNEGDKHFDRYFKINSNPESADFNNN